MKNDFREDTETIREELKTFLFTYGFEAIAPTNFENIIQETLNEAPDLISNMNGFKEKKNEFPYREFVLFMLFYTGYELIS